MPGFISRFLPILAALAAFTPFAIGQGVSSHFDTVEVPPITVQSGVSMPEASMAQLKEQIIDGLNASKHFGQVVETGEDHEAQQGVLRVTFEVTKFVAGNRAARYFVPGAGATKLTVHVVFRDAATDKVLLEQEVNGSVRFGAFGGSSSGAEKTIAKDIEHIVKKNF